MKWQNLLAAQGKLVVPTPAGLQLFELLRGAAPVLVDPGTTAVWEMRLDDVVVGKADFRAVIDEIAAEAGRVIGILVRHTGQRVELEKSAPIRATGRGALKGPRKARGKTRATVRPSRDRDRDAPAQKQRKPRRANIAKPEEKPRQGAIGRSQRPQQQPAAVAARSPPPTEKMVAFARRLATDKKAALPPGFDRDFEICRRFLDRHAGR